MLSVNFEKAFQFYFFSKQTAKNKKRLGKP